MGRKHYNDNGTVISKRFGSGMGLSIIRGVGSNEIAGHKQSKESSRRMIGVSLKKHEFRDVMRDEGKDDTSGPLFK